MWEGHDGMGWWMLWASILWFVFIVAIVVVSTKLGGESRDGASTGRTMQRAPETPLEILRRRYASGELSRDQFEQMRHDLGDG